MTTSENSGAKQDPSLIAAAEAIRHESAAVAALSDRLDGAFLAVVDEITGATGWSGTTQGAAAASGPGRSAGRVVVAGLGKSGIIGRKIAATLASTGTPAAFVHAAEALHGDSGMVTPGDVLLVISASGETAEACQFAQLVSHRGITVIALVGRRDSTLGRCANHVLDVSVDREADPLNLAPTASTTATLVMGDALAAALMVRRGFTERDFAGFHPAGSLGARLFAEGRNP